MGKNKHQDKLGDSNPGALPDAVDETQTDDILPPATDDTPPATNGDDASDGANEGDNTSPAPPVPPAPQSNGSEASGEQPSEEAPAAEAAVVDVHLHGVGDHIAHTVHGDCIVQSVGPDGFGHVITREGQLHYAKIN
jgi:hypothetical protein